MQKAWNAIRTWHMIQPQDRVLVGVSGGADSVCLFMVLLEFQKQMTFEIKVVHVEHGIRGEESLRDERYVRELCEKYQVEYECVSCDIPAMAKEKKISIEEAGRNARYEAFDRIGEKWRANRIAVAHNQNDQAETILWNLARGSGLDGAAGIRPVRGKIIRPLLECSRTEIEAFLKKKNIQWCEDGTNDELDYTRNIIRNRLLPEMRKQLNTRVITHLAEFGTEMRRTEEFLDILVKEACQKMAVIKDGKAQLEVTCLEQEAELLQERILRRCLKEAGCGLKDLQREHIQSMKELMHMQSGKKIQLPCGWVAERVFDTLVIQKKEEDRILPELQLRIPGETRTEHGSFFTRIISNENQPIEQKKYTKWLDYDKITAGILLRGRKPGDYLTVNRQGGRKKLKTYFMEEKIPVDQRKGVWLLTCGEEVIWVVGHRISEAYKVEKNTREILEITYKEAASWQNISVC